MPDAPAEDIKKVIRTSCKAIASGNQEEMLALCLDDTALTWGPFEFKGKAEIRRWAKELFGMFISLSFVEIGLTTSGNEALHQFLIETINKDGTKGLLPAIGIYAFEEGKLKHLAINLGSGLIFQKTVEAERWREELKRRAIGK